MALGAMEFVELIIYTCASFLLFTLLLVPIGQVIARSCTGLQDYRLEFLSAYGLGALFYGAVVALALWLGLTNEVLRWTISIVAVIATTFWFNRGMWRVILQREILASLVLVTVFGCLVLVGASFPDGDLDGIESGVVRLLMGLPVDNVIPYNFSRYIVDRLDPSALEVVPSWSASDRGPLAGILNAVLFLVIGVEEKASWSSTLGGPFFLFQSLLTYLNLLSLLGFYLVGSCFFPKRAVIVGTVLLSSSFFFYQNVMFTWPKFFATFFVLTALAVWQLEEKRTLAGILFGGAILSHNLGSFYALSFLAITGFSLFIRHGFSLSLLFAPFFRFALALLVVVSPWVYFKKTHTPPSDRLLYMHLFCNQQVDISELTPLSELTRYVSEHTVLDLLGMRLRNLIYPFDVADTVSIFWQNGGNWLASLNEINHLVFFQIIYGIGLIVFFLFLWGLVSRERVKHFGPIVLICYGALGVASLLFGCSPWTSTHHWGYPAFLISFLPAGWAVWHSKNWGAWLFSLALALNLFLAVFASHFGGPVRVSFHASSGYFAWQVGLYVLFLCVCLFQFWLEDENDNHT